MVDGNISMEEDTELRDLVVQTLENNGVLAKVRAELRASVFLALEEQESVMIPEPLLNKTVKKYLQSSEGKLLFSLVREFLEYFGLDYTISVYDPETYFGNEYNYVGRKKLCEELGISSSEPLLGEILKNNINGAFITPQKNNATNRLDETDASSTHLNNATFEVSVPKMLNKSSLIDWNDTSISEKAESNSESTPQIPFNVTITDRKKSEQNSKNSKDSSSSRVNNIPNTESTTTKDASACNAVDNGLVDKPQFDEKILSKKGKTEPSAEVSFENDRKRLENMNLLEAVEFDDEANQTTIDGKQAIRTENTSEQKALIIVENNVQNKNKKVSERPSEKSVYFDEIIVDGKVEKIDTLRKRADTLLGELPPLIPRSNSIFSDLPPLNCKKANINDLEELMQIAADGTDNDEEYSVTSASGSANEQSPSKEPDKSNNSSESPAKKEGTLYNEEVLQSEEISEEIEEMEDIISSKSILEDMPEKQMSKFTMGITADYIKDL